MILTRGSDGLKLFKPNPDTTLAIVPTRYKKELILWQHHQLCHGGHNKVYRALKHHWHWPGMKADVRKIVTNCAACQLLKAKRARAHRHFRSKVFCTPRTSWGCDFYGVASSKAKYNNILGAIDLATAECRLFACKNRSAATVTECILQGIVLRDGCPLHIHSDAAKEFISKAMSRLCSLLGCKQTTTLAHHPTGNATIERLWQWVASCLKQMTKGQYQEWEKYVRLIEHVWNTTYHDTLQCTPFEAAHGLPARSTLDTLAEQDSQPITDLMTQDGLTVMKETARAFERQLHKLRTGATERNAEALKRGRKATYEVGEEVSFFIPPTETQVKRMGRKAKHLLHYRGPALIVKRLSGTTYELTFEGCTYYRCYSEIRPYRSTNLPIDLPMANDEALQDNKVVVGRYVTLCDTDEEKDVWFHLCKVIEVTDGKAILLNYATFGKNIHSAKFSIMYQEEDTAKYTTVKPRRNARQQEVKDKVDLDDIDGYVGLYDVKLTKAMRISKGSIKQIKKLGLKHHILGKTFP